MLTLDTIFIDTNTSCHFGALRRTGELLIKGWLQVDSTKNTLGRGDRLFFSNNKNGKVVFKFSLILLSRIMPFCLSSHRHLLLSLSFVFLKVDSPLRLKRMSNLNMSVNTKSH